MDHILLHPSYFGPISQYIVLAKAENIYFENWDNYQKQTHRNRTYIYGANGSLALNLPILHVRIEHQFNTLQIHWKSLESAYRTSPYFEFYEDDLAPLFENKPEFLLDFNYQCLEFVLESLQLDINYKKTEEYFFKPKDSIDYRYLSNPKDNSIGANFESYIQVFQSKHSFLPNLSILDLLFNLGPNALMYLENQNL